MPAVIEASTLEGKLVMLARAQFDVSALYFQKSLYQDEAKKTEFKAKYGYDLAPPDTWAQVSDQAEFFAAPPNFYGTQFAGKEEAINGRFYEMLVAEGGEYLDKDGRPAFNSDAGVRALEWFVNLYKDKAVPPGTTNYLWDDLGRGFASGSIAVNLDWPGWASFFNDPKSSKVAGNVGVKVQPAGSSGKRTGWSGHHGFSVTESCADKEAAASLVWWLTNEDSQKLESAAGPLPTRSAVWDYNIKAAEGDAYKTEVLQAFRRLQSMPSRCRRRLSGSRSPTRSIRSCRRRSSATRRRRKRSTPPPKRRPASSKTPASSDSDRKAAPDRFGAATRVNSTQDLR